MTRIGTLATLLVTLGLAMESSASPLDDFQSDTRRSEGIMAYRVVADTSVHRAMAAPFPPEREVVSAAVEGDLRERWLAALAEGFEPGGDCTPMCLGCEDRLRYRLQFPPLRDSFLVAILWDDHRVVLVRDAKIVGHRTLTARDTAWAALLQATFPSDTPTQMLRASDPGPRPDVPAPGEFVWVEELPEVTRRVQPHYPPRALMRGESGLVMVQALVGPKGRVIEARVTTPRSDFDEPAKVAVEGWRFKPARCGGTPISVWVMVPVRFTFQIPGKR